MEAVVSSMGWHNEDRLSHNEYGGPALAVSVTFRAGSERLTEATANVVSKGVQSSQRTLGRNRRSSGGAFHETQQGFHHHGDFIWGPGEQNIPLRVISTTSSIRSSMAILTIILFACSITWSDCSSWHLSSGKLWSANDGDSDIWKAHRSHGKTR